MRFIPSLLTASLLAVSFAIPAQAGEPDGAEGKQHRGRRLAKFDKNQDGALTQDEVPAKLWERISKADADNDGAVTKEEGKAFREAKRGARDGEGRKSRRHGRRMHRRGHRRAALKRMDTNEDGALSQDEVPAKAWARLVKADADNSGSVTKEEIKAFAKAKHAERADDGQTVAAGRKAKRGDRVGRNGKARGGKKGRRGGRARRMFKRFDKNEDGALSQDEVPEKLWKRLAKADADNSGSVTKEEFKAFRKAKRDSADAK